MYYAFTIVGMLGTELSLVSPYQNKKSVLCFYVDLFIITKYSLYQPIFTFENELCIFLSQINKTRLEQGRHESSLHIVHMSKLEYMHLNIFQSDCTFQFRVTTGLYIQIHVIPLFLLTEIIASL